MKLATNLTLAPTSGPTPIPIPTPSPTPSATRHARVSLVGLVAVAAALLTPQSALQSQSHAAAVAVTSTPGGAVPSIGAGAIGGWRRSLGIRYGRLTDRIVGPETEESAASREGFERDVYTAELSMAMFGGGMRLQLGRSHTRYRFEQADTVMVASPTGVVAAVGYGRQLFDVGTRAVRLGIGADLSAGFADLVGENAISAHVHLPLAVRAGSGVTRVVFWGAPGTAWGSLRGENATVNTASAGLRLELPGGTALDISGAQLLGEYESIWGGSRARLSAGVSYSFGASDPGNVPPFSPSRRPRYSAANDSSRTASADQSAGNAVRRRRPAIMPRESRDSTEVVVAAVSPPAAAPSAAPPAVVETAAAAPARQTAAAPSAAPPAVAAPSAAPPAVAETAAAAPARQTAAARPAPARGERSIFYSPHEGGAPAAPSATPAPATGQAAAPSPAAAQPAARVAPARGASTARPTNTAGKVPTRYTVQAAAVKERDEAIELRIALAEAGFPARILEDEDYFRIRVGIFTTRAAAEQFARRMRARDFEAWVTVAEQP